MASGDDAPAPLTAAEKRAARRARVLAGGERRLQLLTGQIESLQDPKPDHNHDDNDNNDVALEKALDEGVAELLDATTEAVDAPSVAVAGSSVATTAFPPRVDPVQRRRDAQARRQKKEAMVQEILTGTAVAAEASATTTTTTTTTRTTKTAATTAVKTEPAFSRHAMALRLKSAEEKLVLLALVGAALYLAFAVDLRAITTDLVMSNPLFLSYKQLVASGVSLESIRQQMQRENLEPALMDQIERVFVTQRKSDSTSAASASIVRSLVPNVADLPGFFASWLYQPPIILCVLVLRVVVGLIGGALHTAFKLPDITTPQDDDLGFIANLALSSRPALKGYIAKARKSVDDVFLFLWSFVLVVAARAVATAHVG